MKECPVLYKLQNAELRYEPQYTIPIEAVDAILEADGNPDKFITEESRKQMDALSAAIDDHIKSCTHVSCVIIKVNRERRK